MIYWSITHLHKDDESRRQILLPILEQRIYAPMTDNVNRNILYIHSGCIRRSCPPPAWSWARGRCTSCRSSCHASECSVDNKGFRNPKGKERKVKYNSLNPIRITIFGTCLLSAVFVINKCTLSRGQ